MLLNAIVSLYSVFSLLSSYVLQFCFILYSYIQVQKNWVQTKAKLWEKQTQPESSSPTAKPKSQREAPTIWRSFRVQYYSLWQFWSPPQTHTYLFHLSQTTPTSRPLSLGFGPNSHCWRKEETETKKEKEKLESSMGQKKAGKFHGEVESLSISYH